MKYFGFLLLACSAALFAAGCVKTAPTPTGSANTTVSGDEHADHDHEGHDHDGEMSEGADGESGDSTAGDEFGAPPAEPQTPEGAQAPSAPGEPEISLDPATTSPPGQENQN